MGRLITPSILNAAEFANSAGGDWKEKGISGLKDQLSRVYREDMPHYVTRGIEFENEVYRCAELPDGAIKASSEFLEIVELVRGGRFQQKAKFDLTVDGIRYTAYGKLDVLLPGKIIDIKVTGKYQPPWKYLNTAQHLIYSLATGINDFEYRVVVMNQDDNITEHYGIEWTSPGRDDTLAALTNHIQGFVKIIDSFGFTELYNQKFCLY